MTLQSGQQTIVIHILANMSRSKGSQTMVEKLFPDSFLKN